MDILNYLTTIQFTTAFLIVKIIFIIFSLFFFGFIIFALVKTLWLKRLLLWDLQEFFTSRPYGVRKIDKQWFKTKGRLDTGLEGEYKLAIIEADLLLDDILKRMGYKGETLGERLNKLTVVSLSNLEAVKEAHKSRNNIVHDPDYRLPLDEARRTIEAYEKALIDLQAL